MCETLNRFRPVVNRICARTVPLPQSRMEQSTPIPYYRSTTPISRNCALAYAKASFRLGLKRFSPANLLSGVVPQSTTSHRVRVVSSSISTTTFIIVMATSPRSGKASRTMLNCPNKIPVGALELKVQLSSIDSTSFNVELRLVLRPAALKSHIFSRSSACAPYRL